MELRNDPHGPDVALFVGNLPANLSQKNYETIILEYLDEGSKFTSIGPIYYEYGSMLITFDNSDSAVQAYELLRVALYEDKKLLGEQLAFPRTYGPSALLGPFSSFNILKFKFLTMYIISPKLKNISMRWIALWTVGAYARSFFSIVPSLAICGN